MPETTGDRASELLDAAARCFARGGFHATTVAEISLEAGCSPGLLYRYFAGKEALVAALVEREAGRTVAALEGVRGAGDLRAALDDAAGSIVAEWDDARAAALSVQIIAEAARGSAVTDSVRRHYVDILAALADTLRVGQQAGVVDPDLDPHDTARLLVAIVNGLTVLRAVDVDADSPPPATGVLLDRLLRPAGALR